jgi:hypothetical protein
MRKLLVLMLISISFYSCYCQTTNSFELKASVRSDWYPAFKYSINPSNSYVVKINGISPTLSFGYYFSIFKKYYISFGMGYNRTNYSDIQSTHSLFGKGHSRVINAPTAGAYVIVGTDKYSYNNILATAHFETEIHRQSKYHITLGVEVHDYYTLSQSYHVRNNPAGLPNDRWKKFVNKNFGYGGLMTLTGVPNAKKYGIFIVLPVYDRWAQDIVFPATEDRNESPSDNRSKWFRGLGLGVRLFFKK